MDICNSLPPPRSADAVDWSATALAQPALRPSCLLLTLDLILNSPLPQLLIWGREGIMLFNQAYAELEGGLCAPGGSVAVADVGVLDWNRAALDAAWAGQSLSLPAQELPARKDGATAARRVDLYCTPVRDESGIVRGLVCALSPCMQFPPATSDASSRPLQVLVVEDNPDARYLVCEMVRAFGHQVDEADDGESALQLLAATRYDLLFTDVSLPGMSGVELARAALGLRPGISILFASGYGDTLLRSLDFPARYLQKPYELERLQQMLEDISQQLHSDGM